jgi:hypothetical protein
MNKYYKTNPNKILIRFILNKLKLNIREKSVMFPRNETKNHG